MGKAVEYLSPVQVERRLAELDHAISVGVAELAKRYETYTQLKNEVEIESAKAYMKYSGPMHAKKAASIVATEHLRKDLAVADAAYHFARWKSESLREQVSAVQSIGASMRTQFEISGRGAA